MDMDQLHLEKVMDNFVQPMVEAGEFDNIEAARLLPAKAKLPKTSTIDELAEYVSSSDFVPQPFSKLQKMSRTQLFRMIDSNATKDLGRKDFALYRKVLFDDTVESATKNVRLKDNE